MQSWGYEKLVKVIKMDCSTCQKIFSMDEYNSFKLHTSKCAISACTAKGIMAGVELHVSKNKIAHSDSS